ncbi:MAG: hypothetical protein KF716_00915 [Anaerolineae bacterium]|nr:hypothetical protein [Anaerolineae bacterium]
MAENAKRQSDETDASEQFNDILNASERNGSIDAPSDLTYLQQVANKVRELPQPTLPADDKAALRAAMLAEFRKQHAKPVSVTPIPIQKRSKWYSGQAFMRLVAAACLILAFAFGGGALRISAASLPGEPFYGLKRFTEQVALIFTSGDARTLKLSELLQTRLTEVQTLIARGEMITDNVVNDTMMSLKAALQVETDAHKREQLMGQTAVVFTEAQTQGKLNQTTLLVALNTVEVSPDEFFASSAVVQLTPTPTMTVTAMPTNPVVEVPVVSASMTPTAVPSETPTNTEMATYTPTPMPTYTATATASLTPTPTASETNTTTPTFTPSVTYTITASPTSTPTDTVTASPTQTPSATDTEMPTETPTFTQTPEATSTLRATSTPKFTKTPKPKVTKTPKPANTRRPPNTPKPKNENKPENPGGGKPPK